jgi:hypothetical protein
MDLSEFPKICVNDKTFILFNTDYLPMKKERTMSMKVFWQACQKTSHSISMS